jgi:phosphate transport system permease protein
MLVACVILIIIFLFSLIIFIAGRGFKVISWEFLTAKPRNAMTAGGIMPAIAGTFYLTVGAIMFCLPLGVMAAIYLSEYANKGKILSIIRMGINNLAGVPSVVFGLFGMAVFVKYFGFGISILSGSLTLGILALPIIISTAEESLRSVPMSYREASLALGATQWQTISRIVLPSALPGIFTGLILAIGRTAGETAPILFTAAAFYVSKLPASVRDEVQALPFLIYALMSEGTHPEKQVPIAYGTSLVLMMLVLGINLTVIILRIYLRRRRR